MTPVLRLSLILPLLLTGCADRAHRLIVSVPDQRMAVYERGRLLATFPVSTSRFALGDGREPMPRRSAGSSSPKRSAADSPQA